MEITQLWVLTSTVAVMGGLLSWAFRMSINQLIKRLDAIGEDLKKNTYTVIRQDQQLNLMDEKITLISSQLNSYSERIRELEIRNK